LANNRGTSRAPIVHHRQFARRKRKIIRRLEHKPGVERPEPMMAAANIHYEIAEKVRGSHPAASGPSTS
jgi:hypothetical protein